MAVAKFSDVCIMATNLRFNFSWALDEVSRIRSSRRGYAQWGLRAPSSSVNPVRGRAVFDVTIAQRGHAFC